MTEPAAAPPRIGWSWRLLRPALAVLGVSLLIVAAIGRLVHTRDMALLEAETRARLDTVASRLSAVADASFAATATLEVLLRVNGRLDPASLEAALQTQQANPLTLRNIAVAPDNVVRQVHPHEGNERVIGLDYRSIPAQWAQIERTREARKALIFAPVALVQGGRAVIQRRPVFLDAAPGGERYWGTLSAVIDLERFMDRAGLVQEPLRLAVFSQREDGSAGDLIWGMASLREDRHVAKAVPLAGATWLLVAQPATGWIWPGALGFWLWLCAGASLLVVGLTLKLTHRRLQLNQRQAQLESEVAARTASQRAAEQAGERLQFLLRTASDWYWEQDADHRIQTITAPDEGPSTEVRQAAVGQRRWEIATRVPGLPPDEVWKAHRAQCERHEPFRDFEYAMRQADGKLRRLSVSGDPLFDAQGRFTGYRGTARDVTLLHDAREHLGAAQAQLRSLQEAPVQTAMIALDLQGRVVLFSRGAELMLGYSAAEMMGKPPIRLHLREEMEARCAELSKVLGRPVDPLGYFAAMAQRAGSQSLTWTYRHRDGHHLTVSMSLALLRDAQGEVIGYLGMMVDISAQCAAEAQLRRTRDRLQAVLDGALEVGILVCDNAGRITLFNRGAERLFGYAQHEMLGRPTLMLQDRSELEAQRQQLHRDKGLQLRLPEVMTAAVLQGQSALSHWTLVRKSGERFAGALRLSQLVDPEGGPPSYLAIVLDVSAQQRAQQQLEQLNHELEQRVAARSAELTRTLSTLTQAQEELLRSERLAALGSLVAGVAHELNTPLGTCTTAASTLADRTRELLHDLQAQTLRRSTLDAYARDAAAMADLLQRGLGNATELVSHFKQLSVDQTSDQRRRFQLGAVVEDVLTVMRPQLKGSAMRIETQVDLEEPIDGYPGEVGRLITNLIQNAQLHAFEPDQAGVLRIEAQRLDAAHFVLAVTDNGMGMSPEVRRRAFDPFFTTKLGKGGSGLGLNIVFNIATGVLGGEVSLHSQPGQGTRFEFRLPFEAPQRHRPGDDMATRF